MKLKKIAKCSLATALILGSFGAISGCKKDNDTTKKTEQEGIYNLYVQYMNAKGEAPLTYEQWLVSIKGEKGDKGEDGHTPEITVGTNGNWYVDGVDTEVKATGANGADGNDGSGWSVGTVAPNNNSGKNGDFYFDSLTQKIYRKENNVWVEKATISDGRDGTDGKQIEINRTEAYIQWRYVGEETWNNLIALSELKGEGGDDGKDIELQTSATHIQWRYVGEETWNNLVTLESLEGQDGREVLIQTSATHIQWKYEGDETWNNLVELSTLEGVDGREVEFQTTSTHIQWRYVGEETWNNLVTLESLEGQDGREVLIQTSATHIQWKYEGDETWQNLVELSELKGETGTPGTSFISGKGFPTINIGKVGDTYLDLNYNTLYTKTTETAWDIVGSIAFQMTVSSAEEFVDAVSSAYEGAYISLQNDIDLNDLTDLFAENYYIIKSFSGTIDGNGHTLTLPNVGDSSNYGTVIDTFDGILKDITLGFNNIQNVEMNFSGMSKNGVIFYNVTSSGDIVTPSTANYSPLINFVKASSSFINCTNNLNISGPTYGSAFLGGYATSSESYSLDQYGNPRREEGGTLYINGMKEGVSLTFRNVTNNATIRIDKASMLVGNTTYLPTEENIIIENIVNNGTIIGTTNARIFSSNMEGDDRHTNKIFVEWMPGFNDKIDALVTGTGSCFTASLEGLELTVDEDKNIVLNGPEGDYTYVLTMPIYAISKDENNKDTTGWLVASIKVEKGTLDYKKLKYIDKAYLDTLTGATMREITGENVSIKYNSGENAKLYLVTHVDNEVETQYYYYEVDDGALDFRVQYNEIVHCIDYYVYVIAYDTSGNAVGQIYLN